MELREGLLKRRTINSFKNEPVDREVIERALQCAFLAPNHKMTEPWHFYVLNGQTKETLAERRADLKGKKFKDKEAESAKKAWDKAYTSMVNLPWVVAVTTQRSEDDPVRDKEDFATVSCAIQNFMLSAWADGIGTKWATGALVQDKETQRIIGIEEEEELIAILFIGHPETVPEVKKRRQEAESVTWLD